MKNPIFLRRCSEFCHNKPLGAVRVPVPFLEFSGMTMPPDTCVAALEASRPFPSLHRFMVQE